MTRVEQRVAALANWLPKLTSLVDPVCVNYALPHKWLSKGCPSQLLEKGSTSQRVCNTNPDSPSAVRNGDVTSWCRSTQTIDVDCKCAESGCVFDHSVGTDELGIYSADSSSQFALASHETFRETPYTSFLSDLAGETNVCPDLCFTSGQLSPNEGTYNSSVDIDSLFTEPPVLQHLTSDVSGTTMSQEVVTSANPSNCGFRDSATIFNETESQFVSFEDEFHFLNLSDCSYWNSFMDQKEHGTAGLKAQTWLSHVKSPCRIIIVGSIEHSTYLAMPLRLINRRSLSLPFGWAQYPGPKLCARVMPASVSQCSAQVGLPRLPAQRNKLFRKINVARFLKLLSFAIVITLADTTCKWVPKNLIQIRSSVIRSEDRSTRRLNGRNTFNHRTT